MADFTNFTSMSRTEATSYLTRFLAEQDASLERFAATIGHDLAFSLVGLETVWNAVAPRLAWREGYTPPAFGQPGRRIELSPLEPPNDLPSWFHHPSAAGYARFSAETLWLIDGAGRYFGEFLMRTDGSAWESGHSRAKGYIFQNQPIIARFGAQPMSPFQTCSVLASRALRHGTEPGPQTLAGVYRALHSPRDK